MAIFDKVDYIEIETSTTLNRSLTQTKNLIELLMVSLFKI